jgi:hypothetical protein
MVFVEIANAKTDIASNKDPVPLRVLSKPASNG